LKGCDISTGDTGVSTVCIDDADNVSLSF